MVFGELLMENNVEQFNEILHKRLQKIQSVLASKAEEYANDKSRYHNFEVAARFTDTSKEKALVGMMLKHWVSVLDLVEIATKNPSKLKIEQIDEKIGDSINYLILLEGMLTQRIMEK